VSEPYIGQIIIFGFNFAPVNYAVCGGQLMSISQNEALFAVIGTIYGGNGTTNFALPNIQEKGVVSTGSGAGLSTYVIGEQIGSPNVTLTQAQMPQHIHQAFGTAGSQQDLSPTSGGWLGQTSAGATMFAPANTADSTMAQGFLAIAGGSQPHQNEQPYLAMNYCIALYGIFPSQN
jgi:microcystin-dependent protein